MILLRPDCLAFRTSDGESTPCSTHHVTLELLGDAAKFVDETILQNAACGVLHYFKEDLGQETVTLEEFSQALERALRRLGIAVKAGIDSETAPRVAEADLQRLAGESGLGFELVFFARLRDELRKQLGQSPQVLRFHGLRGCVKQLTGAKRWGARCWELNDQIVEFLRTCLGAEKGVEHCALVVQ